MVKIRMSLGLALPLGLCVVGGVVALWRGMYTPTEMAGMLSWMLPVAAAVLVHEMGHVVAARLLGVRLGGLRLSIFGARLGLGGVLSYRRELLIAAAGPAVNLVCAGVLLLPLWRGGGGALAAYLGGEAAGTAFASASVGLALLNLLPVRTLDGGRILSCLLAPRFGPTVAEAVIMAGTALCLGGLWCFSVYALLRVGEMLGLFGFSMGLILRMMGKGGRDG